ncbi:sulfotransferase family protein [Pilimelia terevasa]|uniref:Sulfotransferase family protein n=1 Tax=Pilimelia terevasa TaxID=53372 RepID=A0A8J3FIA4_9ACTN|nr:sulfotransferase [Pilimelia terevasa]GGK32712.1 sulfotransferase family protein [Pilimelia terevasa]
MSGPTVLFVGGLGRSGSTLLELLLTAGADVCAVGEVVHLWERGLVGGECCGCGAPFRECPFWTAVGDRAFGGWAALDAPTVLGLKAAVDRTRHLPWLAARRLPRVRTATVARYTGLYQRIYAAAADVTGARLVVDSSKHASLAFALRWAADLDLRVLHLVRDAPAVAHSWGRRVRRPEITDRVAYMPVLSPARASGRWLAQNAAFDLLARRLPVHRLRYEDFVAAPDAALAGVRAFAGLPPVAPDGPPTAPHSIAGNPLRFRTGPLTVRRDDTWREDYTGRRRWTVAASTWPLRLRYGYLGRTPDEERR